MNKSSPIGNNFSLDSFFGATNFSKGVELSNALRQEVFTPKDLDVSYTNLNYWDRLGVLSSNRKGKTSWRNFNFLDYVWIRVIMELRELGVPINLIKVWRDQIFQGIVLNNDTLFKEFKLNEDELIESYNLPADLKLKLKVEFSKIKKFDQKTAKKVGMTYFFYSLIYSLSTRIPVSLIFFSDGICALFISHPAPNCDPVYLKKLNIDSHVRVSISKIIRDFLMEDKFVYLLEEIPLLEKSEIRLLELVNSGNYESITIRFKDRKIKVLEMKKAIDVRKKIVDILNENSYQDITIKVHKGITTFIENTIKEYP